MRLSQFYTSPYVEQALESYSVAVPSTWSVSHKLDLYNFAKVAFESDATEFDKEAAFEQIYESLRSGWQVFRNAAGPCWSAAKTLQVMTSECKSCSRQSSLTAANLVVSDVDYKVKACLSSMGQIKPTMRYPAVYPWMAVSKFLHFFNPCLFPIYDMEFIWKKVADGVFRRDYQEFCKRRGFHPKEDTQRFNLQYTLWASEIMAGADSGCMTTFAEWFSKQVGTHPDPANVMQDIHQYYAAAFEMIAIGAAQRVKS